LSVNGQVNIEGNSKMRVTKNDAQIIPTTAYTRIQYNNEVFDTLNEYDNVTNHRFTAKNAGYYDVKASVFTTNAVWTADQIVLLAIYKNGVLYSNLERKEIEASGTFYMKVAGSDMVYLNVNDYIEIFFNHNIGSDLNLETDTIYNYFSVHRIN
jgi:hypothetical protein